MVKNIYKVNLIQEQELDVLNEVDGVPWSKANDLIHFESPWSDEKISKIVFKALWNDVDLFFRFEVEDKSIHIEELNDSYESIGSSDRVELFFRQDSRLNPYYCLEIDSKARIMDFKASPDRKFDFEWNWPTEQIKVKSKISKKGFIVEGSISINSLKSLNLIKNGFIEAGIYRAKYNVNDFSEYTPTWITWVNPMTNLPDFHIDSSFGVLKLA
ncbi:sugar-binding protein [Maribacter sp. ACAM166]|uniref:sugar-binding protein n=1 Tax=Maribacter sp. ACAM166 TaxID=2508996 RepID=UPI0010FEED1A|nr:sugar-binding protein [Maribacter sp. ACAM166]TLP71710.1 endoxylanase [Maribacter sp. ACAM166]